MQINYQNQNQKLLTKKETSGKHFLIEKLFSESKYH